MPLLDYVERSDTDDETILDAFDVWNDQYGSVPPFRKILANNPDVLTAWNAYYGEIQHNGAVDQRLKELAHVIVAQVDDCAYCASSHGQILVERFDVPIERLYDVKTGDFDALDETERAVATLARQIAVDPKDVDAEHVDALRAVGFDDEAIIELFVATCSFICATHLMDALGVDPEDHEADLEQYYPE